MNKKLFSAALFGALLLGTASTFVSCKDYDDDIAGLQTQINDVKAAVSALEAKVNAGKFVTGINSTADGITISLSDGSSYSVTNGKNGINGTNGTNGVDGTNGTEWTISEDGFWVCNGEKTEILAVGQKGEAGENGQDAQPEVKKENGKWYLWNGEEFEEFTTPEAPAAANVPYYFIDPNDTNYAILVFYDETGSKPMEIRLPLNSGLAQITIISGLNMDINYHMMATDVKNWIGDKEVPAKGEYLVTQPNPSFLIQVTPANYDLSALDLQLVNAKGDVAPVILGEPTPYTGKLTRTVSESGVYEVTVAPKDFSAETIAEWKDNFKGESLSLVANESVRSTYAVALGMENLTSATVNGKINTWWHNPNYTTGTVWSMSQYVVDLNESNEVTLSPKFLNSTTSKAEDVSKYIYDTKIVMNNAASKSDSIKCGLVAKGATISIDESTIKENSSKTFRVDVHYLTAAGYVGVAKNIPVRFTKNAVVAEPESFELAEATHTANAKKQFVLVSLDKYFDKFVADEASRIVWNTDATIAKNTTVTIDGEDKTGNTVWEYVDNNGDAQVMAIDLISNVQFVDAEGKNADNNAKATHLKVTFDSNYGPANFKFETGTVTAYMTVKMAGEAAQIVALPLTIKAPAAAEITKAVGFKSTSFKDGVLTILNATQADLYDYVEGTITFDQDEIDDMDDLAWVGAAPTSSDATIKLVNGTDDYGKTFTIAKAKTTLYGKSMKVPAFKVQFVNPTINSITIGNKAFEVACKGANSIEIKGNAIEKDAKGNVVDADKKFFTDAVVKNFAGVTQSITGLTMQEVEWDETANGGDGDYVTPTTSYLSITNTSATTVKIESKPSVEVANAFTTTVKVTVTLAGSATVDPVYVTVTIKGLLDK